MHHIYFCDLRDCDWVKHILKLRFNLTKFVDPFYLHVIGITTFVDKATLQLQTLYATAQSKLALYQLSSNSFSSLLQRVDAPCCLSHHALVRQAPVAPNFGATGNLSHHALVRQAPVAPNFGATGNLSHHALVRQAPVAPSFVRQAPVAPSFVRQPRCEMLGGLYGYLPPPSDEDKPTNTTTTVWSIFAPPQTILKPQSKPKTTQNSLPTRPHSSPAIAPSPDDVVALPQPALVDVTSTVIKEHDPARPNDYEDYRREKKKKEVDVEINRELERRRQEEEEREMREKVQFGPENNDDDDDEVDDNKNNN
ncbi:hypothetical protein WN943_006288 [Citrus x changshan-huyou]